MIELECPSCDWTGQMVVLDDDHPWVEVRCPMCAHHFTERVG
ncbi:ribosomal protein S27E [Microbacterium resistens]|uniref:Ribosomal protein S27E n=1 Tax=Microbacterium resistens TaxID=156977 RepID=A0ABU1SH48_9MICO|nr:hypothetical protein [Microbacterium resistens]MDR6867645.1 ribosomal protein S27E [Microbacterium resistens]MDR6868941.1 ribosomal protein S27E [Microbacterium resistens]